MAEKKPTKPPIERKIVDASTPDKESGTVKQAASGTKTIKDAKPAQGGNATGLRIGAFIFWLLGIGCEVFAILVLNSTISFINPEKGTDHTMLAIIVALAADLVLVIIGSQLWKKSNDIDPASEKNKVKFFLWNNMGLIASVIAFAPIIVLLLSNKELDQKTKRIVVVVAAFMLMIAGAASIDYNPTSAEQKAEAEATAESIGIDEVYWTPFGRRYHLSSDCQSLTRSATIYRGSIEQAFEANRNSPCSFCAKEMEELTAPGEEIPEEESLEAAA